MTPQAKTLTFLNKIGGQLNDFMVSTGSAPKNENAV